MEGIYAEELGVFPLGFMVCFASLQVLPSTLFLLLNAFSCLFVSFFNQIYIKK